MNDGTRHNEINYFAVYKCEFRCAGICWIIRYTRYPTKHKFNEIRYTRASQLAHSTTLCHSRAIYYLASIFHSFSADICLRVMIFFFSRSLSTRPFVHPTQHFFTPHQIHSIVFRLSLFFIFGLTRPIFH